MQHCESINLDEYRQSGEGGTAITYKHNSRNSLAKLYKSGFEADMAIEEFKTWVSLPLNPTGLSRTASD